MMTTQNVNLNGIYLKTVIMLQPSWSCSLYPVTVMNANIHCRERNWTVSATATVRSRASAFTLLTTAVAEVAVSDTD